jgi:nitrite reductase/ring-hydroxylating ferredoxin subunit
MSEWFQVAQVSDCPPQSAMELVVEDHLIAIYNVEGTFYALDGVCPHQGGPLGKGRLEGCTVKCPWHGWQFDIPSGAYLLSDRIRQTRYDVCVEGDIVLIRIL